MSILTPRQAARVLARYAHRGARSWKYDPATARVRPAEWNGLGNDFMAPELTVFEAQAVARGLVELHRRRGLTRDVQW